MSCNPQSMNRQRASMSGQRGIGTSGADVQRASSYSTCKCTIPLLLRLSGFPGLLRPSDWQLARRLYDSTVLAAGQGYHSRHPSSSGYHSTYPIATPSSVSHELTTSPFLQGMAGARTPSSTEPSPPLNGLEAPVPISALPSRPVSRDVATSYPAPGYGDVPEEDSDADSQPLKKPSLAMLDTGVHRNSSDGSRSGGSSSERSGRAKHKSSVDRLRHEASGNNLAGGAGTGNNGQAATTGPSSRAPSPSIRSDVEGSSRATSPNPWTYAPSQYSYPQGPSQSFSHHPVPRQYQSGGLSPRPRPYSTISMTGSFSGAPHGGRRMMLQMPELLGVPRLEDFDESQRLSRQSRLGFAVERFLAQQASGQGQGGPGSGYGSYGPYGPPPGPPSGLPHGQWDGRQGQRQDGGPDPGSMAGVGAGGTGVNVIGTRRSMDALGTVDAAQRRSNNRLSTLSGESEDL